MKKRLILFLWVACSPLLLVAQQYTGMSGLIHTPSADMDSVGNVRIGSHWLNKEMLPEGAFVLNNEKYNTADFYLSITPYPWVEIGYTFTLFKAPRAGDEQDIGYYRKDRYFSLKLRVLKEKNWYPSIAFGTNDPITTSSSGNQFFANYYLALTKHFSILRQNVGIHITYRRFKREINRKWNGVVGGLTLSPSFYKPFRLIVEYTGQNVNIGADCLLFKHFRIQTSLQSMKYSSGGLCFQLNLL